MLRFFVAYSEQPGKSLIILYFLECQNKLEIRAEKCFYLKRIFLMGKDKKEVGYLQSCMYDVVIISILETMSLKRFIRDRTTLYCS